MNLSKKQIKKLQNAITIANEELHTKIATCPDPEMFAETITAIESLIEEHNKLYEVLETLK